MALQINYEDQSGTIHAEAYARVRKLIVDNLTTSKSVTCEVEIFASVAAKTTGKTPLWGPQAYTFMLGVAPEVPEGETQSQYYLNKLPGEVAISDCYTYLKTLTPYQEGVDC